MSNNRAENGAGIYFANGGILNIINSNINANIAHGGAFTNKVGGVFIGVNGTVEVQNTILSDNIADTSLGSDFGGVMNSKGYNLIKNARGIIFTNITTGNIIGVDPQLLPLGDYGGATQTRALRPSSPAIDKAAQPNFTTALGDQRGDGFERYDFSFVANAPGGNGYDIGAFELQYFEISNRQKFDFDGDSKSDIAIFRPTEATWYIQRSSAGFMALQFGFSTDRAVPSAFVP